MIKGLHHSAHRCRNSEKTLKLYEEFLGLKLVGTLEAMNPATNGARDILDKWQAARS